MKAQRIKENKFVPVTLTLESQKEVDGIYTFLRHNALTTATGLPANALECLEKYISSDVDALFTKLHNVITGMKTQRK